MKQSWKVWVVIRFQVCIFDILNTAFGSMDFIKRKL